MMNGAAGTTGMPPSITQMLIFTSVPPKGTVPPPAAVFGPNWPPGPNPAFNFTKLGVRVPSILISAWYSKLFGQSLTPTGSTTQFPQPNTSTALSLPPSKFCLILRGLDQKGS